MTNTRKILIIEGHPDAGTGHYDHALVDAYAAQASAAGHAVDVLRIAELEFPVVRNPADWLQGSAPADIAAAQARIMAADHVVLVYPLWLGDVPALLKAFLEQVMRPGFATETGPKGFPRPLLKGRSARVIVTMGMPALAYKLWYRAHSLKSLKRNVLRFAGIAPVASTVIGSVASPAARAKGLEVAAKLGAAGA